MVLDFAFLSKYVRKKNYTWERDYQYIFKSVVKKWKRVWRDTTSSSVQVLNM